MKHLRKAIVVVALVLGAASHLAAQPRAEKNVVYGMYSGLALLMDVYYPAAPAVSTANTTAALSKASFR